MYVCLKFAIFIGEECFPYIRDSFCVCLKITSQTVLISIYILTLSSLQYIHTDTNSFIYLLLYTQKPLNLELPNLGVKQSYKEKMKDLWVKHS